MFKVEQIVQLVNNGEIVNEAEVYGVILHDALVRISGELLTFDRETGQCREYEWLSIRPLPPTDIELIGKRLASLWSMSNNLDMSDKEFRELIALELPNILHELEKTCK